MLFDTDVLIFVERGHQKAAQIVDNSAERFISVQTYMELLQDAQNKKQHTLILSFLKQFNFVVLPLTENIGKRAAIYVEEYSLSHSVRAGDAIIAATAIENNITLITANYKHFKPIKELSLHVFKPEER
jgi:predicted nucleic acid-binding protein